MIPIRARISNAFAALRGVPPAVQLTRPTVSDFTPIMWAGRRMTPDQVRFIIEGAVGGNLQEQWALFDMMEDTWPRLTKNLSEVRRAAARVTYAVKAYAERGEEPTESAQAKADLVESSLSNWRPKVGTLELGFEDTLFNGLDALGKGLAVLESTWHQTPEGLLPRCAHLLHPRQYGWSPDGTELGLIATAGQGRGARQTWEPFPPDKFLVGVWHARSGVPGQTALLRCLAPYWCGITFGWEWLLNNAQIFGVPFRWATYDATQPGNLATLSDMLANLGSAGCAAFPQGTTLEFKEATKSATDNPQVFIQILGQEASSESKPAGLGNGASALHGSVRADRLQDAAQWCADLLNYQLVPAILRANWGDESEPPEIVPELVAETDPKAKADRDQVLAQIAPLPRKWFYGRHAIPEPQKGEETVGGPGALSLPLGGGSGGPLPGARSDARPPGAGLPDPAAEKPALNAPGGQGGGLDPSRRSERFQGNPPTSAEASVAAAGSAKADPLPGGYELPDKTRRALAAAHARDLEALRKAAGPLLVAIEAGQLGLIGELEAFIARLDSLAPHVIGASDLADVLEGALAEASIAGAAGAYAKADTTKP